MPSGLQHVVAVRWAYDSKFPFPEQGFSVECRTTTGVHNLVTSHKIPGATQLGGSGYWTIDPVQLELDRLERSAVSAGPDLPSSSNAAELAPALTFLLAKPDPNAISMNLEAVGKMFGHSHSYDVGLDHLYWHGKPVPDYPTLLQMEFGGTIEKATYRDVVLHYRKRTAEHFRLLAAHFGLAKFIGLGLEWQCPVDPTEISNFKLSANLSGANESSISNLWIPGSDWPPAPHVVGARQGETLVGYPAFGRFFGDAATWRPVRPKVDPSAPPEHADLFDDLVLRGSRGPRMYPAPVAQLQWKESEAFSGDGVPLLARGAYAWRIERHAFGAASALMNAAPPIGTTTSFTPCHDGEFVVRSKELRFEDDSDVPYGEEPPEGWYAYRVAGIDVFGIAGPFSDTTPDEAKVRLLDVYSPPPPSVRILAERIEFEKGAPGAVEVEFGWDALKEFTAPDTAEFRVRQVWTAVEFAAVIIETVVPLTGPELALNSVQVDVRLRDSDDTPLHETKINKFVGGSLLTPNGEFAVLGVSGASMLRVRRSAGRAPPLGDASVRYAQMPIEGKTEIFARRSAITGTVRVVVARPPIVELVDESNTPIPFSNGRIYFHVLGESFAVQPGSAPTEFAIVQPEEVEKSAAAAFEAIWFLPSGQIEALMDGSPAVFLPDNVQPVLLEPPDDFVTGTVRVIVVSADDARQVTGPNGIGNESSATDAVAVAIAHAVPKGIENLEKIWARDAAEYADLAEVSLIWPEIVGAVRYDVDRALEGSLGCTPASADQDLVVAARPQENAAFGRVSSSVFLPRFRDLLPGRAPTRAIYRVRGVSAAGTTGDWILVALVRVPDVRIPSRPSLLLASPIPSDERSIVCTWTVAGHDKDFGFVIEVRDLETAPGKVSRWQRLLDLLPGSIEPDATGRLSVRVGNRPPGRWQELRILSVRHALDPDDPRAILTRRIEGEPSNVLRVRADGDLRPVQDLRVSISANGRAELHWRNSDRYEGLELRARPPGRTGFERSQIDRNAQTASWVLTIPGVWTFEIAAMTEGRRAVSQAVSIEWIKK
ncbi:hypothetical protein J5J86_00700 [Aquabacter sp. L1I39]|uniref:hypothetical protein n=1 Tax=Aquabacter sp. L1I39 TaxID=2820278 RepID=UPI001ADB6089|nr:hypothetical protein [Aquabacter sp. L1I39]QTL03932.1 hypothetical protein J5J86_00700 [Aquabacter sp. L1I39]